MNTRGHEISDPQDPGELVAHVPHQDLKSLFYLFTGKPDSRVKTFERAIELSQQDIVDLNTMIVAKLQIHDINASVTNVKIGYEGSQFSEFGTWDEFCSHTFLELERIEEIILKWDFLVNIKSYKVPQRHTLLFRVARELKPSQVLHMLGAGNHDEIDKIDMMSCPAFCRVDFINAQLSKELINVVNDWYLARIEPRLIQPQLYWIKKNRNWIALLLDQWTLFTWSLVVGAVAYYFAHKIYAGNPPILISFLALFFGIYSLRPASKASGLLVNRIYKAISEIEGSKVVFKLTAGDKKKIAEQRTENSKQGRKFVAASAWNIILNILATIICMYLFKSTI